jgi:hypothetical protein
MEEGGLHGMGEREAYQDQPTFFGKFQLLESNKIILVVQSILF